MADSLELSELFGSRSSGVEDGSSQRNRGHGVTRHVEEHDDLDLDARNGRDGQKSVPDREERLWFWRSMLQNAAASEVAVNVCLPWFMYEFRAGLYRAPSEFILAFIVLFLNLSGAYMEGFCKQVKTLSQPLRKTKPTHQMIFVTSQSFCDGFLNVLTSFPDIAGTASTMVLASNSMMLGAFYMFFQMLAGILCYLRGRSAGRHCTQHRWSALVNFCQRWHVLVRVFVLAAFVGMAIIPRVGLKPVPLDLTAPELDGVDDVRIVYDEFVDLTLPPMVLGLCVGIFMSASGAALAVFFCDVIFDQDSRPAARFLANLTATVLVLSIRQVHLSKNEVETSFILLKVSTSFCGALSAFSGTIGDVADAHLGAAVDERSAQRGLGPPRAKGWLPNITAFQNFAAHYLFLLVVMYLNVHWAASVKPPPIVLQMRGKARGWIHEQPSMSWNAIPHSSPDVPAVPAWLNGALEA